MAGQRPSTAPGPRVPQRPAPEPQAPDDDGATQAFNVADFDFLEEGDATQALDQRALMAHAQRRAPAEDTSKRTILGHPGVSARTANAVRGSSAGPRRSETLAMDGPVVPREMVARMAAQAGRAPAPEEDEGEATMAVNIDAMLSAIDDHEAVDDGDATQAMNMDAMLAEIDAVPKPARQAPAPAPARQAPAPQRSAPPARSVPAPARAARPAPAYEEEAENESTQAVDMDAMLATIDDDGAEATMAMSLDDMADAFSAPPAPARQARGPEPAPAAPARAPKAAPQRAAAPAPVAEPAGELEIPAAVDASGLLGSMRYALAFDGRRQLLSDGLADVEAQMAEGGASRSLAATKQELEAELAALDPEAAKRGWITFGGLAGGFAVLMLVLGIVL